MQTSELHVIHNAEKKRFEIQVDSYTAVLAYLLNGNIIVFTHTGVPPELEGRGIGSLLVKTGMQYAKEHNLKVNSLCWFVSGYIERHPEFQDLLA
ncbi:GNAT family N-acetyltransferase [Candidatus Villigracilis affinis]|uniref:GNAT family N-acetyltransferase n=1 Tax=Candidatus Villigracilis affinis TaxID=3140682 RepID=UPI0031E5AF0E